MDRLRRLIDHTHCNRVNGWATHTAGLIGKNEFSSIDVNLHSRYGVYEGKSIRSASLRITPHAMLGRGASVIRGKTLIINLPGSPKACMESMDVFLDAIPHGMALLRNEVEDCARP